MKESELKIDECGTKRYYLNCHLHREGGPAVEYTDGTKCWYQNGFRHREDGAATQFPNGTKYWFYNDQEIECSSQEEFERIIKLKAFW